MTCALDGDCDPGFYCGPDGTCTADCTPGGNQCGDGQECGSDGRCIEAGPGPDAEACPSIAVAVDPLIPTVWLVIDQSGSMTQNFNGVDRWDAVRDALVNPTTGVVTRLQDKVKFGASLYTSNGGNAGGTCPILSESMPSMANYADIDNLLRTNGPQGDTPTSESIVAVTAAFPPADPANPAPRIIVLATDGDPDNCVDANAHNAASQAMSETAVASAYTAGIETFVLSVGDDVSATHLQRVADIGIGETPGSGAGTPYVANDPTELSAAFEDIIRGARTCEFTLDKPVDVSNQCSGTVSLNGTVLECGTDWHLTNDTTLELLGGACDTFLTEDSVQLDAEFPCGVVIL